MMKYLHIRLFHAGRTTSNIPKQFLYDTRFFSRKIFFYNKKDFLKSMTTLLHQMITLYPVVRQGIMIAVCLFVEVLRSASSTILEVVRFCLLIG